MRFFLLCSREILRPAGPPSPTGWRINRRRTSRGRRSSAAGSCFRSRDAFRGRVVWKILLPRCVSPFPEATSTNVAAIFPQSRNFRARLPNRQPVTTPTASVAQRSISTKVTRRLRSLPWGSSIFNFCNPSMARRTPRIWPAHKWPCAFSASRTYSSNDFTAESQTEMIKA